jgi:hypothetical protein
MRTLLAGSLGIVLLVAPVSLGAWSMDGHRYLTRRAIDGLPAELRPFFAPQIDFISEHAADPDLWRTVDLRGSLGTEDPNHYLDLDVLDEPEPFTEVPRDWNAFVARYGEDRANRAGRLPWRTEEIFNKLVAMFQDVGKPTAPYAADNARYLAAVLSHYVEDAHVPLHATGNHDGAMTNQRGVHARFESELVRRNQAGLTLAPVTVTPIANIKDFIFATLVTSQSLVAPVLDADQRAAGGRGVYDDAYYSAFFTRARPILEQQMSHASSAVASAIVSAWEHAGKPKLATAPARH